jgi:hypothetical protein
VFRGRRRVNEFADGLPDGRTIRQCFGKRMLNREQARQTVAWMKKHRGATDTLSAYRCSVCRRWHVGNERRNEVV